MQYTENDEAKHLGGHAELNHVAHQTWRILESQAIVVGDVKPKRVHVHYVYIDM